MPSFKKNLIADCLIDDQSDGNQNFGQADQVAVSCENFESRINELLDKRVELSRVPSLKAHTDGCMSCRQTLQQYDQLTVMLGSAVGNTIVEHCADAGRRPRKFWQKLPTSIAAPLSIVAMLAVLVGIGNHFNGTTNEALSSVAVAPVILTNSPETESPEVASATTSVIPAIEQVSLAGPSSVLQLQGLVDSGSEWLAAGRQQAAVIQGLSDVRLDLDLDQLEARLTSLQPVLSYSGRIPALSPMQGTVCFTLGWLKKGKTAEQPKLDSIPNTGADLGMRRPLMPELA